MTVVSEIFREQEENGFIMYVLFVVTSSEYLWKSALINTRLSSRGTVTGCHDPISFYPFLSGAEQTPTQSPSPTPHAPTMSPSSPTHYSYICHLTTSQLALRPWEWHEGQAEEAPLLGLHGESNSCTRTKRHEDQGEPLRKSVSKQPWQTVSHFPNTHPVDSETQLNMSKALIF